MQNIFLSNPLRLQSWQRSVSILSFVLMLIVCFEGGSQAHTLQVEPVAIVLRPQESFITADFSGNVQDITQIPDAQVTPEERDGDTLTPIARKRIQDYINEHLKVKQGTTLLTGKLIDVRYNVNVDPAQSKFHLAMRYPRPKGESSAPFRVESTLFSYLPNALATVNVAGFQRNLRAGESTLIEPKNLVANLFTNIWGFLLLGIEHIFTGPDHILFILGLLLVSDNLKQLIKTLTGFTIAHSITLILTTLGVFHVNARIVDIFVAISIIYIGVENLFVKSLKHRFWIASCFGLVHGFAFAANLRDAGLPEGSTLFLSLLSFNLGVETAQVMICAAVFPLLMLWKRDTEKRVRSGGLGWNKIVQIASCGVILVGGRWLLERIFSI